MEKDKKYNIVLGFMIFFFILFVGVCIAWGLGFISVNTNTEVVNDTNTSTDNETVSYETTENKEVEQTIKEVIKEVPVSKMLEYDYTKSKNIEDNSNYNGAIAKTYYEMTLLIYSDGSAKISVILDGGPMEYPIENLKGKVRDGMIGRYLQGIDAAYLLLEDGTVQRVSDFTMFKQIGFKADEVITGVNNIVRLETIINAGGKRIPIAIDKDGYYYSLM